MLISEFLYNSVKKLNNITDTPELDVKLIVSHYYKCSLSELFLRMNDNITDSDEINLNKLMNRRLNFEPIAYITGTKEFYGLEFDILNGVLIPRYDTELIVENIIELSKKIYSERNTNYSKNVNSINMLEIGCGSGAITISCLVKNNNIKADVIDISDIAIKCSKINAQKHFVENRMRFFHEDAFSSELDLNYDIIVSNPPYISRKDMSELMRDVKDYEPFIALFGGEDGLDFYRNIVKDFSKKLNIGGYLVFEIGYNQAKIVSDLMKSVGFKSIQLKKDLAGIDRCLIGSWE